MNHNTVRLRAAARQFHGGLLLMSGDTFYASAQDAADLVAMKFALPDPLPLPEPIAAVPAEEHVVEEEEAPIEVKEELPAAKSSRFGRHSRGARK